VTEAEQAGVTDETLIARYIELRDEKNALKDKHKEELEPFSRRMGAIEDEVLARLHSRGTTNTKGPSGTAYTSMKTSAKVTDRDTFLNYVIDNSRWALLTTHVTKEEVELITSTTGEPPPGVEVSREIVVNFRRS
jgi:hypothetical protein